MQPNAPLPPSAGSTIYPNPSSGPLAPAPTGQVPVVGPSRHTPVGLIVALVIVSLLLCGALGFGLMELSKAQDYKLHSDKKAATAVTAAKEAQAQALQKEFTEKEKNPLRTYLGPSNYGTLHIEYPKTWSAFVTETSNGSTPVDGYAHPSFVPGLQTGTAYALRFQIVSNSYASELKKYDALIKTKKITVAPFKLVKLPSVTGVRLDGEINPGQKGTLVLLPLRDKSIEVSTQSVTFAADFNNIILPNLTFEP